MSGPEIMLTLVIAIGLAGVLVPLLPGSALIAGAAVVWAFLEGGRAWFFCAAVLGLLLAGAVVKYLVPGRRLQRSGVPNRTLLVGGLVGFAGFFVVPVIGLPLGFVLGVYLAERSRLPHDRAWPATVAALRAVGLGMAIELGFATLAALVWLIGAVTT